MIKNIRSKNYNYWILKKSIIILGISFRNDLVKERIRNMEDSVDLFI